MPHIWSATFLKKPEVENEVEKVTSKGLTVHINGIDENRRSMLKLEMLCASATQHPTLSLSLCLWQELYRTSEKGIHGRKWFSISPEWARTSYPDKTLLKRKWLSGLNTRLYVTLKFFTFYFIKEAWVLYSLTVGMLSLFSKRSDVKYNYILRFFVCK